MSSLFNLGLWLLLVAGAVVTLPSTSSGQKTVEEQMRVVESAIVVKPPALRVGGLPHTSLFGIGANVVPKRRLKERDLIVYLGETPVEVTGVQRLDRELDWTVLIYFDAALTRSQTLFRNAIALSKSADRLTSLGPVELLVADPHARVRLPPTRFPYALQAALAEVAMDASGGELGGDLAGLRGRSVINRNRTGKPSAEGEWAANELIIQQVAALSRSVRNRCNTDACLLLLVSEGFSETPSSSPAPARESASAAACCWGASRRLARELAASRWLVGVVVVQEPHSRRDSPPGQRPPEMRQLDAAIPPENYSRNAATTSSLRSQSISLEKLDLVVRLNSEPLKRVARASGGFLAATADELNESLGKLDERVLVWFRHPLEPPEDILPLRVVFAPGAMDLWAPHWWRFRKHNQHPI